MLVLDGGRSESAHASDPVGHYLFATRGLRVYFENRGHPNGWSSGEVVQRIAVDLGMRQEVALQLDEMRKLGVNEIGFELRSVGDVQDNQPPPDCRLASGLGVHWPVPLASELTGLRLLMDLLRERDMRLVLHLTNSQQQAPFALHATWIGPILDVVKDDPVLDYVTFDGSGEVDTTGDGVPECGGQWEAALWMGRTWRTGEYVAWAIDYALRRGMRPESLSAAEIVGNPHFIDRFGLFSEPAEVMKSIFDDVGIPDGQRTYALSSYTHRKCEYPWPGYRCTGDMSEAAWTDETFARVLQVIGRRPGDPAGPRVVLSEYGDWLTGTKYWTMSNAVETFGALMTRYGIDGGSFWQWAEMNERYELEFGRTRAVKRRGLAFAYNPVVREIIDIYGFHLDSIRSGSFEPGWRKDWRLTGRGTAKPTPFTRTASLPWRGPTALELTGRPAITLTSNPLRVSPNTTYTTTGNLSVRKRGASIAFLFRTCTGQPSPQKPQAGFALRTTRGFQTFPFRYTTPEDACSVRIQVTAGTGGLLLDNFR